MAKVLAVYGLVLPPDTAPNTAPVADAGPDQTVRVGHTVPNTAPVADAGPDQTVRVGHTVTLDGSHSTDVDGDRLQYRWLFDGQPRGSHAVLSDPTLVHPTFVADRRGIYMVQLIVNDGKTNSTPDTVAITTTNTLPVAKAGPDQTIFVGTTVHLDGSKSSDVDGDALLFTWSLIRSPSRSTATLSDPTVLNPTFVVDKPGTYVVRLIVNDGTGNSAPAIVTITTINSRPVADAGPDQLVVLGQTVPLDGSKSHDVDGDQLTFRWSLLSQPPGVVPVTLSDPTAVHPTFVANLPGTYVVQLIVHDGAEESLPDTVVITTQNSRPVANAGPDQSVVVTSTVHLDGSASSDRDGEPLSYRWSFTATPAGQHGTAVGSDCGEPDVCGGPAWDVCRATHRHRRATRQCARYRRDHDAELAPGGQCGDGPDGAGGHHRATRRQQVARCGWRHVDFSVGFYHCAYRQYCDTAFFAPFLKKRSTPSLRACDASAPRAHGKRVVKTLPGDRPAT